MNETIQAITDHFNALDAMARAKWSAWAAVEKPSISFGLRGTRAGVAWLGRNELGFNVPLLAQNETLMKLTVAHELAHLIAFRLYHDKGHGKWWRYVCLALGGDGKRCFNTNEFNVQIQRTRRTKRYLYRDTAGGEVWLGSVHHKRLQTTTGYALRVRATGALILASCYQHQTKLVA